MKVTHLCLACFFPDGYSYQENMLPKYHKKLGFDVSVIASLQTFDEHGRVAYMEKASEYKNEYGIQVYRLDYKKPLFIYKKLKRFIKAYETIEKTNPDILFIHGCQFLDMNIIVKYKRNHPNVKIYIDNHADFSNSGKNWLSLNLLHKILWRKCAKKIEPFTEKFYGVLPARVDFLTNIYKLPQEKCELLVMGADDEKVYEALQESNIKIIKNKLDINDDETVIMTGGKIDNFKRQTLLLMEAINKLNHTKIKLIVFGSVIPEMKDLVHQQESEKVKYIGWVASEETYKYFAVADLVVFPGRHSVFWEQVAGLGKPMVCKKWEGTTHVNVSGNVRFLTKDSCDEICEVLSDIIDTKGVLSAMTEAAQKCMSEFSYKDIARRSIQCE